MVRHQFRIKCAAKLFISSEARTNIAVNLISLHLHLWFLFILSKHRNPPTNIFNIQILHRSFNQKSGKIKLCSVCPVCNRGCVRPSKFESTPENDVAHVWYVSACLVSMLCYHLRCCLWLGVYGGGDTFYKRT